MNRFKELLQWMIAVTAMLMFMAVIIPVTLFVAHILLRYFKIL